MKYYSDNKPLACSRGIFLLCHRCHCFWNFPSSILISKFVKWQLVTSPVCWQGEKTFPIINALGCLQKAVFVWQQCLMEEKQGFLGILFEKLFAELQGLQSFLFAKNPLWRTQYSYWFSKQIYQFQSCSWTNISGKNCNVAVP